MTVLTLLLGGLVALNVAALRSTIAVSDVNTKVRQLQQQNRLDQAPYRRPGHVGTDHPQGRELRHASERASGA